MGTYIALFPAQNQSAFHDACWDLCVAVLPSLLVDFAGRSDLLVFDFERLPRPYNSYLGALLDCHRSKTVQNQYS